MAHYCPGYLRRGANIYHRKAASKHAPPGVMRRVTFARHTFVELLWMKGSVLSIKHCTRRGWARLGSEMPPSPWECQAWSICGILKAEPEASTSLCWGDTSAEDVDCGLWQKQKTPADQKRLHWKQNACVGFQLLKLARNLTNYSELCADWKIMD